ncbi:hypothetical protein RmaAA338_09440 [Rhodothermus marinus]|nr:hypothetical protein RmaAA338_09440 [Rhodothermus marinus]
MREGWFAPDVGPDYQRRAALRCAPCRTKNGSALKRGRYPFVPVLHAGVQKMHRALDAAEKIAAGAAEAATKIEGAFDGSRAGAALMGRPRGFAGGGSP